MNYTGHQITLEVGETHAVLSTVSRSKAVVARIVGRRREGDDEVIVLDRRLDTYLTDLGGCKLSGGYVTELRRAWVDPADLDGL